MAEKYGRKVRELMVKEMKDAFTDEKGFVISSIENVKAAEMDVLRKKIRQSGSRYMVIKNRLACIALEEAGIDGGITDTVKDKNILGIGIIKDDPVQMAKFLVEFSKKNPGFKVSRGYLEGRSLEAEKIKQLAALPSREQLIAMVVGMMNAPIANFVGVLGGVLRSLVYAIKAVKEKKEESAA
ncbi:50S ribosomal protein L10 [Candidatus Omnitrophota bacterium]